MCSAALMSMERVMDMDMDKDTSADSRETEREQHSLPGTNMAGKGPGDECEPCDEHNGSGRDGSQATQRADDRGGDTSSE